MKTDLFQSCGHCWVFQIWCHIECSTLTAPSFRTWTSSAGIPSPPLALFVVMLPKATWLHIPGCLALGEWSHYHDYLGCEDFFCTVLLCILATSSCHIFCFCWVHTISVLYRAHLCMKCSLGISNFVDKIFSLSHSIVFLNFFALTTEKGFFISPCYSLELCIQMDISFLFSFASHFSSFLSYL